MDPPHPDQLATIEVPAEDDIATRRMQFGMKAEKRKLKAETAAARKDAKEKKRQERIEKKEWKEKEKAQKADAKKLAKEQKKMQKNGMTTETTEVGLSAELREENPKGTKRCFVDFEANGPKGKARGKNARKKSKTSWKKRRNSRFKLRPVM